MNFLLFILLKNTVIYRTKVYGKIVLLVLEDLNIYDMLTIYCTLS